MQGGEPMEKASGRAGEAGGKEREKKKRGKNNGEGRGFQQVVCVCQIIKLYTGTERHLINSKHCGCH